MDGGELFSRIQDRGDQAFTERGTKITRLVLLLQKANLIKAKHAYLNLIRVVSLCMPVFRYYSRQPFIQSTSHFAAVLLSTVQ
jgi:hypothetical protein